MQEKRALSIIITITIIIIIIGEESLLADRIPNDASFPVTILEMFVFMRQAYMALRSDEHICHRFAVYVYLLGCTRNSCIHTALEMKDIEMTANDERSKITKHT